jgi:hypothetical protein
MKKIFCIALLATACGRSPQLTVKVEGAGTPPLGISEAAPGEPIHRVVTGRDGKVLFAYDLEVRKQGESGKYRLLLKPSQQKPTFEKAREVTVNPQDESVRVELMERPGTGEKVVDVFSFRSDSQEFSPMAHLRQLHNHLFRMVHGH